MASPQNNYETLYGVHLLDDLHNFFPALLYDSSSFRSVQDVLGYIQRQSRARFDLFSYGLREYQSSHSPAQNLRFSSRTLSNLQSIGQLSHSNLAHGPVRVEINLDQTEDNDADTESEDEAQAPSPSRGSSPLLTTTPETAIASLLLQMLSSSREIPSLTTRNILMPLLGQRNQFLEPVVVRPTVEQVEQNTTVGRVASDQDISCSICQDTLQPEQEGRKLNACGHWFHKTCIDTWFERAVHCPVCRHDIREPIPPRNDA